MARLLCYTYEIYDCLRVDFGRLCQTVERLGGIIQYNAESARIWVLERDHQLFELIYPHIPRSPQEDRDTDITLDWSE